MAISRGNNQLFKPLANMGRGRTMSSASAPVGGGDAMPAGPVVSKADRTSTLSYQPAKGHGVSTSAMLQHKGKPGQSAVTNSRTGARLNNAEVAGLGPLQHSGWDVQGMGSGGRIGSASGARNSKGRPTSQRGQVQRYVESGQAQNDVNAAAAAGAAAAQQQAQNATAPAPVVDPTTARVKNYMAGGAQPNDAKAIVAQEQARLPMSRTAPAYQPKPLKTEVGKIPVLEKLRKPTLNWNTTSSTNFRPMRRAL